MRNRILASLALLAVALTAATALARNDADDRAEVTFSANRTAAHGEVLCLAAASVKVGGLVQRRSVAVQNLGALAVYLCPDATCTSGDGLKLDPGEMRAFDWRDLPALYCRATVDQVAGTGLRYIEVR